jgi:hypothetical protein
MHLRNTPCDIKIPQLGLDLLGLLSKLFVIIPELLLLFLDEKLQVRRDVVVESWWWSLSLTLNYLLFLFRGGSEGLRTGRRLWSFWFYNNGIRALEERFTRRDLINGWNLIPKFVANRFGVFVTKGPAVILNNLILL